MAYFEGSAAEILPKQYSAHSSVQELGGASFAMRNDGSIVFCDDITQNLYRLDPQSGETELVLKAEPKIRYAGFSTHPFQNNSMLAIKEDHTEATPTTQAYGVHNTLVSIDASTQMECTVAAGGDFYAYPSFSPDGLHICWIQWSHPDMPWTGTVLYVADWEEGKPENVTRIVGQWQKESISQPKWAPDGKLFYTSDESGYWQLYTYDIKQRSIQRHNFQGLEESDFAIADWHLGR